MGRHFRARLAWYDLDIFREVFVDVSSEGDMQDHDSGYCSYRNIKAVVVTWNAGASTPTSLRYNENSSGLFASVIRSEAPPDILVFGFQELVDLEDKKLTASVFSAINFDIKF